MTRDTPVVHLALPWAGFIGALFGGALWQQIGAGNLFRDCAATGAPVALLAAAIGFILVGAGGYASSLVLAAGEAPSRRLIAGVSVITAALVAFAILLSTIYSLIVPACFA